MRKKQERLGVDAQIVYKMASQIIFQ